MDDYMEMGDSGWAPKAAGWFYHGASGMWMDENGRQYDKNMVPIDTDDDEGYDYDSGNDY